MRHTQQMGVVQYLNQILAREMVDTGPDSPVLQVAKRLVPLLQEWAGDMLLGIYPSGSFAKGTAVLTGTDIDLFISVSENCPDRLGDIYEKLFKRLEERGLLARRQDVSINITAGAYSVDLVPAKRQNALTSDHSLWRNRARTWTKTNIAEHIDYVITSGRQPEIRILKLWRNQKELYFPSFNLELAVIRALDGYNNANAYLENRIQAVFDYLRDVFPTARFVDPANTSNIVSDDLTISEKQTISVAAKTAREAFYWTEIVQ